MKYIYLFFSECKSRTGEGTQQTSREKFISAHDIKTYTIGIQ